VLADRRTQLLLQRYLPGCFLLPGDSTAQPFLEYRSGQLAVASPGRWSFSADSLRDELERFVDWYDVPGGTRGTVVSSRRAGRLDRQLAERLEVRYEGARAFGNTVVLPVPVSDYRVLAQMARAAAGQDGEFDTVLWPSAMLSDSAVALGASLAREVINYRLVLGMMARRGERKLYERTPALALWTVGLLESVPHYLRAMDGLRDTTVGSWRLELLARDSAGTTGAFRLSSPAGAAVDSLVRLAVDQVGEPAQAALLPDAFITPGLRSLAGEAADNVLLYSEFYRALDRGELKLADLVPALAFWQVGDESWHMEPLRQMDSVADYQTENYRFTLLAVDPDTAAGLYLIQLR